MSFFLVSSIMLIVLPFNLLNAILFILIAYILYLPCRGIEKKLEKSKLRLIKKKARPISVIIIYVLFLIILIIAMKFLIPRVYDSIIELINK